MAKAQPKDTELAKRASAIPPPRMKVATFRLQGTAPYVQHKFSVKAREQMRAKQEAGSQATKGKKREPKDFEACYQEAMYRLPDGSHAMPASCYRAAMISACRIVGFKMTIAKLSLFVEADGYDSDGVPLVRIQGLPVPHEATVRNETGVVDIRVRPMWHVWACDLRVRFDADQFSTDDVANLLSRVGLQVGIGEGRPDSRDSAGMGWGTFEIAAQQAAE